MKLEEYLHLKILVEIHQKILKIITIRWNPIYFITRYKDFVDIFYKVESETNVDANLLASIAITESSLNPMMFLQLVQVDYVN
jgi:hypothetical protein